jgi:D-alanyl-D-alanine carboxypeptidase
VRLPGAVRSGAAAAGAALACALAACSGGEAAVVTSSTAAATATIAAVTTTAAATTVATPPVVDAVAGAALQEALERFVPGWADAGVSAAVLWPDGALWEGAAGFADYPAGVPLSPGDAMVVGSTTKTFTATVVLQLVEEGVLGLDEPVAGLLPDLGFNEALTLRHLLGHRSGLWNYTSEAGFGFSDEPLDPEQVVRDAVARGELFPPGTHFHYSNTNYTLLGLVIEAATGNSAEGEIRSRILEPLGLEETFMAWYEERTVSVPPSGGDPDAIPVTGLGTGAWTAGALASTPADLAHFGAALFAGDLLTPGMVDVMLTPGDTYGDGAEYGLGVEILTVAGRTVWGHRGGMPGYQSALFYLPESGITVAVCANSTEPGVPDLRATLVNLAG